MRFTQKGVLVFVEEELLNTLTELSAKLRKISIPISTSEVIDAIKIIKSYCYLNGLFYEDSKTYHIGYEELKQLIKTTLIKKDRYEQIFEKIFEETLYSKESFRHKLLKDVETYLKELKLHYGDKISISKLRRRIREGDDKETAFYILRKLDIIRKNGKRGIFEVAERKDVEKIITKHMANIKTIKNLAELANYAAMKKLQKYPLRKIKDERDLYLNSVENLLVSKMKFENVSSEKLLNISNFAYSKGKKFISRSLAEIIANRILANPLEAKFIEEKMLVDIFEKHHLFDLHLIATILNANPKASEQLVKTRKEEIINIMNKLNIEAQRAIVNKLVKMRLSREELVKLLTTLNPRAFSVLEKIRNVNLSEREEMLIKAAAKLARAFEYFRKATLEDNKAYLDMAKGAIIEYNELMNKYKSISEPTSTLERGINAKINTLNALISAVTAPTSSIINIVHLISKSDINTLYTLKEIYEATIDETTSRNILHIASIVAQKLRSKIKSQSLKSKREKTKRKSSSIIIRDTIYNMLRNEENPVVYRIRKRETKITLLIDTSGSMKEFAEQALLIASAFAKNIGELIVFKETALRIPKTTLKNPMKLVNFLFTLKFEGWTNITAALNEASRRRGKKTIVMISDLKQTVKGYDLISKAESIMKCGVRLIILTPPIYDKEAADKLKFLGARIIHIKNLNEFVKKLTQILTSIWT